MRVGTLPVAGMAHRGVPALMPHSSFCPSLSALRFPPFAFRPSLSALRFPPFAFRPSPLLPSVQPDLPLHARVQLRRIVSDAALEHRLRLLAVGDARRRVAADDEEVGALAGR